MRRYDKSKRGYREELDARLDALQRTGPRRISRKRRSNVGPTVLGVLLVLAVLAAVYLIYSAATGAESGQAVEGPVRVEVVKGDTLSDVATKLEEAGVIKSAFVFKLQARYEGYGTEIRTGRYTFEPGQESDVIFRKLAAGKAAPTIAITVPEGLTLRETARTVAADSPVSASKFERAARRTDYGYAFLDHPGIKTTEGYLFPARYDFEEGVSAGQIVDRLLGQYLLETEGLDLGGAKERLDLSEHQLVTVASLIEKEAATPEEKPLVGSVIYNRMDRGMPLQIDATIQYALAKPKANLSLADLRVDSPYNTYENKGLPPGPICSPSRESLEAALNPERTTYLYYVLEANGRKHFFTSDYDDFLRAKAKAGR
ncbi:MAG: endolytic transglycosylase MltG [Rubrobacteraceae bacterium]|nr:endolytic transglycosylase MltG [Rubrobacteraceae bacterium]